MQPPTDTGGSVPQQRQFELPASGDVDAAALVLHLAAELNSQADLPSVLQTVTDTATTLSGARFGAFFYNAFDDDGFVVRPARDLRSGRRELLLVAVTSDHAPVRADLHRSRLGPQRRRRHGPTLLRLPGEPPAGAQLSGDAGDRPRRRRHRSPAPGPLGPGSVHRHLGASGSAGGRARGRRRRERPPVQRAERCPRAGRGPRPEPGAAPGGHLPAGRHVQRRRRDRRVWSTSSSPT